MTNFRRNILGFSDEQVETIMQNMKKRHDKNILIE